MKTAPVDPIYSPMEADIVAARHLTGLEKFFEIKPAGGRKLDYLPGQFVVLSIPGIGEAPISISSSPSAKDKDTFQICVRKVGTFTGALHKLGAGGKIGVRGPFGKPYPVEDLKGNDVLIIAGGLGIVPLRSLINFVIDRRRDYGTVHILLGCREPKDRLFADEISLWKKATDVNYACTVDRADPEWKGNVGVITTLIPRVNMDVNKTYAVVVGPPIMYKFVIAELLMKGFSSRQIILSLERRMKCGLGKCGHCQINNKYVCQDGPTFTYEEVRQMKEALQ